MERKRTTVRLPAELKERLQREAEGKLVSHGVIRPPHEVVEGDVEVVG